MESIVAFFERRSIEVLGREVPQILILHANQLNADQAPALIKMFRRRGYSFVSLDQALSDPAYALPTNFAGKKGLSWIHRWGLDKGLELQNEPDTPQWIRDAAKGN
jgi:hypothetical protein